MAKRYLGSIIEFLRYLQKIYFMEEGLNIDISLEPGSEVTKYRSYGEQLQQDLKIKCQIN